MEDMEIRTTVYIPLCVKAGLACIPMPTRRLSLRKSQHFGECEQVGKLCGILGAEIAWVQAAVIIMRVVAPI